VLASDVQPGSSFARVLLDNGYSARPVSFHLSLLVRHDRADEHHGPDSPELLAHGPVDIRVPEST
jgi:hypothetical protein